MFTLASAPEPAGPEPPEVPLAGMAVQAWPFKSVWICFRGFGACICLIENPPPHSHLHVGHREDNSWGPHRNRRCQRQQSARTAVLPEDPSPYRLHLPLESLPLIPSAVAHILSLISVAAGLQRDKVWVSGTDPKR